MGEDGFQFIQSGCKWQMNVFYTLFLCFCVEEEKGDGSMVVVEEDGAKNKMDWFCL